MKFNEFNFLREENTQTPVISSVPNIISSHNKLTKELTKLGIKNFKINPDTLEVDVDGDLHFHQYKQPRLPARFGVVTGNYTINNCTLETLDGSPHTVNGYFVSMNNPKLHSAVGGPQSVPEDHVSFEGSPIVTIAGLPKIIGGYLILDKTGITSISGISKQIRRMDGALILGSIASRLSGGLAGLLNIRGLTEVQYTAGSNARLDHAFKIINKHLQSPERSGPDCVLELQDAGLSEFARL